MKIEELDQLIDEAYQAITSSGDPLDLDIFYPDTLKDLIKEDLYPVMADLVDDLPGRHYIYRVVNQRFNMYRQSIIGLSGKSKREKNGTIELIPDQIIFRRPL